ncbi:predicted protein [Plenodomus lingam JN3]|uniref:Predicted protein n=1 Tax=Leptosphaeria maculans (strain JN3 / isolate v23.1.3 / race Av1-4-5-6-7-8) TaxID=985895 RepID=E5A441_LEPMJ|nr:predicted protein [Plenodomus lingam JN3]CBX98386.1 predicted protein [Plenodomus lingam JN3]
MLSSPPAHDSALGPSGNVSTTLYHKTISSLVPVPPLMATLLKAFGAMQIPSIRQLIQTLGPPTDMSGLRHTCSKPNLLMQSSKPWGFCQGPLCLHSLT